MPAVSSRSWNSATIAPTAIFDSNRIAMKMQTATRKTTRPRSACVGDVAAPRRADRLDGHLAGRCRRRRPARPTTVALGRRAQLAGLAQDRRVSPRRRPAALDATSAPASSAASCTCAELRRRRPELEAVPPANSMPKLKPRKTIDGQAEQQQHRGDPVPPLAVADEVEDGLAVVEPVARDAAVRGARSPRRAVRRRRRLVRARPRRSHLGGVLLPSASVPRHAGRDRAGSSALLFRAPRRRPLAAASSRSRRGRSRGRGPVDRAEAGEPRRHEGLVPRRAAPSAGG